MSRGLVILCLIALAATPLVTLAESAERLAASLLEESEPGVIDPVDGGLDDGVSLAADSSAHPLDGVTIGLAASILDDWTGVIAPGLLTHQTQTEPAGVPFWPSPSRERRLSWLQTFVI